MLTVIIVADPYSCNTVLYQPASAQQPVVRLILQYSLIILQYFNTFDDVELFTVQYGFTRKLPDCITKQSTVETRVQVAP